MIQLLRVIIGIGLTVLLAGLTLAKPAGAVPWVTAYYPSYEITTLPISSLNLNAITHLVFFHLSPTSAGALTDPNGGINANAAALATKVHQAGKKVLICIGGADTEPTFATVLASSTLRTTLVNNIVSWVSTYGFDGVDVDDEPLGASDGPNYEAFITALRSALPAGKVLTAAVEANTGYPSYLATVQSSLDQINVMTYDMSGPWEGYTWYNSNLLNGSGTTSCAHAQARYTSAGISASKLAIGCAFYGYVWDNATSTGQTVSTSDNCTPESYEYIMDNLYLTSAYHWDSSADAPYLSLTAANKWVSYDDPTLAAYKVDYITSSGLGGLICFELGQDYMPDGSQPLLTAIENQLATDNALSGSNIAPAGTGYVWYGNSSSTSNSNRTTCVGVNDGNLTTSNLTAASGEGGSTKWEGGGVVWSSTHKITSVVFINGNNDGYGNGYWQSGFGLQISTNGTTWTNLSWTCTPTYAGTSAVWGQSYTFTGTPQSGIKGIRVVGESGSSSWTGSVIELAVDGQ